MKKKHTNKEEHLYLPWEEVKSIIKDFKNISTISRSLTYLKKNIESKTFFLDACYGDKVSFACRVEAIKNDIESIPTCKVCQSNPSQYVRNGKPSHFSNTCANKSCKKEWKAAAVKKTFNEKYGVDNPNQLDFVKDKKIQTNLKRYGVPVSSMSDSVKDKIKQTNRERYGSEVVSKSDEVKMKIIGYWNSDNRTEHSKKIQSTVRSRYGVDSVSQLDAVKDKIKSTQFENYGGWYVTSDEAKVAMVDAHGHENYFSTDEFKSKAKTRNLERYGVEHHLQSKNAYDFLSNRELLLGEYESKTISEISQYLGCDPSTVHRWITEVHGHSGDLHVNSHVSYGEKSIISFLESLGVSNIHASNRTILGGRELDIYLPDYNLAIEFNGLFWHSSRFKDKRFHQDKSLMCLDKGIQLIHIWEDDWKNNRPVVESKLKSKLGLSDRVFARRCSVVYPPVGKVRELYDNTHLQGFVGATAHIGLAYDGELVACMSLKHKGDGVWDLSRFSSSLVVVGGFSKILKEFKRSYNWSRIYTFAHLDYSHGNLYKRTGFTQKKITAPGMWYVKGDKRFRREQFMKHLLPYRLERFDSSLTELDNMINHGFYQLFDSGSIRFEMDNRNL